MRTGIAAAVVAGAVHLAQSRDVVVDFTRPIVLQTLRWLGNDAVDCGEELRLGKLLVPWTRDCAGINLLFILLALAVWVNRKESRAWRFWLCMLGMVPAAAAANVLRVLTLLAYRTLAYPGVESPQTHYFIGFIWLVPFITLITPRDHRPLAAGLMETLHAAAVVALLAPLAGTPNAMLLTLAAILCLSQCRLRENLSQSWPAAAWMAAGTGIGLVGMESFWLPWLLLCPLLAPPRWVCSVPGIAFLACTHSLIVMQPWSWAIAAAGLAWACFHDKADTAADAPSRTGCPQPAAVEATDTQEPTHCMLAPSQINSAIRSAATHVSTEPMSWARQAAFFTCLTFPFLASTLLAIGQQNWEPPTGVASRCISPNCYEIRLPGQPEHLGLACYSAPTRDRHHTLTVCLKYRGIELTEVEGSPLVLTDGTHWFRECFLQDGHLFPDYPAYVRSTFIPWSDPGVHLIFVSAHDAQTPGEFSAACEELAQRFYRKCEAEGKSQKSKGVGEKEGKLAAGPSGTAAQ